jgi:cytochrome c peroxidase
MSSVRVFLAAGLLLGGCNGFCAAAESESPSYAWNLPKGFPIPWVPPDNPMTTGKVELGRYLFYDTRMSINGTASCATCHKQELAFTDGRAVGLGATGESHSRGPMSLVNVAWNASFTWSNPQIKTLEEQALVPMRGVHPVELGLHDDGAPFLPIARSDATYRSLFARAFPGENNPYTLTNITKAIAAFERSIISGQSPYDRYHYGRDDSAISDSARRGEGLFFNQHLSCFRCHGGFDFSDATTSAAHPPSMRSGQRVEFHNTGLYNPYLAPNVGIVEYTKAPGDQGKFKTPTLRNIALTAPYMHDGSLKTLEDVLDHYAAGGKNGHDNPNKDPLIGGFTLSAEDRADLIEFLKSLTDEALIHDPRFSNPWPASAR